MIVKSLTLPLILLYQSLGAGFVIFVFGSQLTISFLYRKLREHISFSTNLVPLIYMDRLFLGVWLVSVIVGREMSAIGLTLHTLP